MKIAWLFPGQGAQEVGMGKALAEASAAARGAFARADAALGEPISRLCFEGPMEELTRTSNTQPAIVATSCAVAAALIEHLPDLDPPLYAAGHSLGEYSALVAAGALEIEEAVRLCRIRGAAMQEAVPAGEGAMAALIGLEQDVVLAICAEAAQGEVVAPANYNGPGQIVIAGHSRAVSRAGELAVARGGKAIPLKVSAPFHCALMRPAAERLRPELERTQLRPLAFPVIANVDAAPNADPERVRSLLLRQVDGTVQWMRTIERMAEDGVTHALEIGPGKVLAGLVKRITKQIKVLSVSDMAGIERVSAFLSEA
ncbi:ACP S-malonyltransferase [Sorangium sp. So ce542]|uniref:ACP S-malonyltransferase n=1 Tax=Sorangium sp. So ce542 TaxID=3133316 RepID=UPI003F61D7BA